MGQRLTTLGRFLVVYKWQVLFALVMLTVYVGSETVLRHAVYTYRATEATLQSDISHLISSLPPVIRDWVENRRKVLRLEAEVAKAATTDKKIAALSNLAGATSGSQQRKCFQEIVTLAPNLPVAAMPLLQLLREEQPDDATTRYLAFARGCQFANGNQRLEVWQLGLSLLPHASDDLRMEYLQELAKAELVASSLLDAYEQLRGLAARRNDAETLAHAKALAEKCEQRLLEEYKTMRR